MPRVKSHSPAGRLKIRTATPSSVRKVNRAILLELIRKHQPVSRAELARLTGIFRSSVSDIVDELVGENLVLEERATPSRPGRVPMSLSLNDSSYPILGINIRPSFCQIGYAQLSGRILHTLTFETPTSPEQLVGAVSKAVQQISKETGAKKGIYFKKIGVAIPGHVDAPTGRIVWAPTHPELTGFPIAKTIEERTGIPTLADNDCNVGALSELWLTRENKEDKKNNFVFLNVSDFGAGAGAILNGEIYLGHDGHFATEVGHMIVERSGRLCPCGRKGCWELYVCNSATWKRYKPRVPFTIDRFDEMLSAARRNDQAARAAVKETVNWLSLGVSNIGFVLNPAEIVISGRINQVWDLIIAQLKADHGSDQLHYSIRPARMSSDDSLLHGAICLALRDVFARPKFGEG